ncbi:hypothetical protein [Streptococcus sobrinus]|uniref:Uncharacterized protein n=1 Tax=Streptococcus sobrinus TaxID=1310 RepID=A0ABN5LTS0_9STRE|nr:hypothetical protein DK182_07395 [Streptococcus sobrinus]AWN62013.1 hypothetical protein DLJ52_07350 [Streptococcus sobrinus]AWN63886.1 hypothetical protein DLJ51_07355 [Streptococcus sobrinus]
MEWQNQKGLILITFGEISIDIMKDIKGLRNYWRSISNSYLRSASARQSGKRKINGMWRFLIE